MGDVVGALSEWIVSKNYQQQDNIADKYIEAVQNNAGKLDAYNIALKKYNQSLLYARQGSLDLAVIQLKKVLSIHDKFVAAHLLLALVAMETNQIELARKELKKVLHIDRGNLLALNYLQETEGLRSKSADKKSTRISKDAVAYTSGNETIIQPKAPQESSGRNVVLDILLGLIIGMAICWFVFAPAKIQSANNSANQQVIEYSDQLEAKTATIDSLNKELDTAKLAKTTAESKLKTADAKPTSYDSLFEAQKLVKENKNEEASEVLKKVDAAVLAEGAKAVYDEICADSLKHQDEINKVRQYVSEGRFKVYQIKNSDVVKSLYGKLHYGELEVIVGAKELGMPLAIIDEQAARKMAGQFLIDTIGILGILTLAKNKGIISEIKPEIDQLRKNGYRISDKLYQQILLQNKEWNL